MDNQNYKETWTVEMVKDELPIVPVIWQGGRYYGQVSGRLNEFASVAICGKERRGKMFIDPVMGPIFSFSWVSIARVLSSGGALKT